jgi:N-methylhydantoinase A
MRSSRSGAQAPCTRRGSRASSKIGRIVVPRSPGILCAMGLLLTDLRSDFATTRLLPLKPDAVGEVAQAFAALEARTEAWFAREGIGAGARAIVRTIDMRYSGQNYELPVPLPPGPVTLGTLDQLSHRFAQAHERMYGFVAEDEPVDLVTFRVEATGRVRKAQIRAEPPAGVDASHAIATRRDVWIAEKNANVPCPVYARDRLKSGNRFAGPAVIEQMDATTFVLPDMKVSVDPYLNLILEAA